MKTLAAVVVAVLMGCGPAVEPPLQWSLGAPCEKWGQSQCIDKGRLIICDKVCYGDPQRPCDPLKWESRPCNNCPGPQMPLDGCDAGGELCFCG